MSQSTQIPEKHSGSVVAEGENGVFGMREIRVRRGDARKQREACEVDTAFWDGELCIADIRWQIGVFWQERGTCIVIVVYRRCYWGWWCFTGGKSVDSPEYN